MFAQYIPKRFANAMLKHLVAVTLLFPYFYSSKNNLYYQDFTLSNFFAILTMIFIFTSWKIDLKRNGIFLAGLGMLLIAYNGFATYMNYTYHHWYGEQINTTIAFLFFATLLMVKDSHALVDSSVIRSVIHLIVVSCGLSLWFYKKGITMMFVNNRIMINHFDDQYSWLYHHKSQYAFLLVLSAAFFAVHKKYFRNVFTYILSQGLVLICLYVSDVYTSLAAVLLIFIGQFLDYLAKAEWWKKLIVALLTPILFYIVFEELFSRILENRDIMTLGYRIPIWKNFYKLILDNPNGMIDAIFGQDRYPFEGYLYPNNCHNIFLNHMFRFSILVGGVFVLLFILLILFSFKRDICFLTIFIWGALLTPLFFDHSLKVAELPLFLFMVYCMFFEECNRKSKKIPKY